MRLLNCRTLEFKEFFDDGNTPEYLILSHRWGDDEISYKDFRKGRQKHSSGYKKIIDFCTFASHRQIPWHHNERVQWVWIDTCCIDKRSSAELSEAINSMYRWYGQAMECIVHLSDVPSLATGHGEMMEEFMTSRWFTRGWTLQELLAPKVCVFCTSQWEVLGHVCHGDRCEETLDCSCETFVGISAFTRGVNLVLEVAEITGIQRIYLEGHADIQTASIARRMSWAAHRQTTRVEDQTYCLLGIFGLHMPLLYGEQGNAFHRLQEELIRRSDDQSILAFNNRDNSGLFLATNPFDWSDLGDIIPCNEPSSITYSITNRGLEVECVDTVGLAEERSEHEPSRDVFVITLNCRLDPDCAISSTARQNELAVDVTTGRILAMLEDCANDGNKCTILSNFDTRYILSTGKIVPLRTRKRKFVVVSRSSFEDGDE